jgi:tRNA nucleotidyltransferase (CCA-adding enzyme)
MPDYMYMLESRLSAEQRAVLLRLQKLAAETNTNVYLTGGAVRDLISGMPIRDLDFTVEGNPARLVRELEKEGARALSEDEKLRHVELIFPGDVDGSVSAARDDVYARPGTKPEIRWSTIVEDLHRRDFSLNAVAISLNPASRGLLLDPTNGLADLQNREVRALSIHSFTNQPVRLLRAVRYSSRMDFKIESRTADWFALALERELHEAILPEDAGRELRQAAREDKPIQVLKGWEERGLMAVISPQLAKRHPHYEMLARILRARDDLASAGLRGRMFAPVTFAILARLKDRERATALHKLEFRSEEVALVLNFEEEVQKIAKLLSGPKTAAPGEAFAFLEKTPADVLSFLIAESSNSKVLGKIRNYRYKWKPLRQALPAASLELESIGMGHGPKFDKVIEQLFQAQLAGKARSPELRIKLLRKLSGIKELPKKKIDEKDRKKLGDRLKKNLPEKESAKTAVAAAGASSAPISKPGTRPPVAAHVASPSAEKGKHAAPQPAAKGPKPRPSAKKSAARKR